MRVTRDAVYHQHRQQVGQETWGRDLFEPSTTVMCVSFFNPRFYRTAGVDWREPGFTITVHVVNIVKIGLVM